MTEGSVYVDGLLSRFREEFERFTTENKDIRTLIPPNPKPQKHEKFRWNAQYGALRCYLRRQYTLETRKANEKAIQYRKMKQKVETMEKDVSKLRKHTDRTLEKHKRLLEEVAQQEKEKYEKEKAMLDLDKKDVIEREWMKGEEEKELSDALDPCPASEALASLASAIGWDPAIMVEWMELSTSMISESLFLNKLTKGELVSSSKRVQIKTQPFAQGADRKVYFMYVDKKLWVAKKFQLVEKRVNFQEHLKMMHLTAVCQVFAKKFNELITPYRIGANIIFLDVCVFAIKRSNSDISAEYYMAEPYTDGDFQKFNDNFGLVFSGNMPNAFSHWTFEYSGHQLMVVDVQGIEKEPEKLYWLTDPAIHSLTTDDRFGLLDHRKVGMDRFLKSHTCNEACKCLKLL